MAALLGIPGCEKDGERTRRRADVVASEAVAQVKAWMTPVGSPEVQQLKGVAHDGRMAVFFSLTEYTASAQEFAQKAEVALFRIVGYDGSIEPSNDHARHLLSQAALKSDLNCGQSGDTLHVAALSDASQAAILRMLDIGGFLLICCKSSDRYIQFTAFNQPDLFGETVSNNFLPLEARLTTTQLDLLVRLGWREPNDDRDNFHQRWKGPEAVSDAVTTVVATLVQVHGVREVKEISITVKDALTGQ